MKKIDTILFIILIQTSMLAQMNPTFIGAKSHYGFIIAHSPELKSISQTNPYGLQLEYSWLKTSDKAWKTCFCYGKSGFAFAYFNYANPDILGDSYNLIYFVEPYFTYKGPLKFSLRGSVGVTYLDRIFDQDTNPENLLFSTHLSFYLALSLNLNYHINNNYAINASLSYNHISNGGQKQPNKGMNFPTFSIGVDKIINNIELKRKPKSLKSYDTSIDYYLGSFVSLRSSDREAEASNHLLIGFTGGMLRPVSGINGLNAGIELWYDFSDQEIATQQGINDSAFSSSITAGHHFSIGSFYFLQQLGFYITRPKNIQSNWLYQRYSFWYSIGKSKRWTIGASLIAYGKVADHMDGRLIYLIN
ncbi:Lipid A 3-O-deacylase (PagL) [Aquimarina amphilecti]|uniref:Lipid A 3-O-deacylase (PagL) n=1 Tax=Aquimarina amphilecti TaxID=1038014 RepID=A0A1H7TFT7_AQUAM|nr:acyloxyacyl hydrolase [Aquimarina amphilecti]SEL83732.1 Lipid A 3-O-deacylase (PagL) [Aquimarina amphilecti]